MARSRYKKSYSTNRKTKRKPVKTTKVYKDGMRNNLIIGSGIGLVIMAMFFKVPILQELVNKTYTYEPGAN